jgi:hypothetical protein
MANRILYPAAPVTVAGCRGYALSAFLYGAYGKGVWPELSGCLQSGTVVAGKRYADQQSQGIHMSSKRAYGNAVAKLRNGTDGEGATRLAELGALAELGLGEALDARKLAALALIQSELQSAQQRLKGMLDDGQITPPDYLKLLNATLAKSMERSLSLLGVGTFNAIFGDTGHDPEGLIDAEMFLQKTETPRPQ